MLVHSNLGRSPLSPEIARAALQAATRPVTLEYDLHSARRGDREGIVAHRLRLLTGAEAATAVNNNAAAVLLALNTLALGREVPVSRGELIEIGGSFRLPEVMERAGCRLREVGTTNRTHPHDYEGAIGEHTALLLKAHTSNYRVSGFTRAVSIRELAAIAHRHNLPRHCGRRQRRAGGHAAFRPAVRADASRTARRRRGSNHLLRRQAARREPSGHPDRTPDAHRAH